MRLGIPDKHAEAVTARVARHPATDPAGQSDDGADHQYACESIADDRRIEEGERFRRKSKAEC